MRAPHHKPNHGRSAQAVEDALVNSRREAMTAKDVARIACVGERTAHNVLRQLRREKRAYSCRALTLYGRPLLWSRWSI